MNLRIAIVDDNENIATQIAEKLLMADGIDIPFMASSGAGALALLSRQSNQPDIILMDIDMPGMNGIEATFRIRKHYPDVRIIMLTVFDHEEHIFNAIRAGANGYLLKDEPLPRMLHAFSEVMEGAAPMSPQIAQKTLKMLTSGYKPDRQPLYANGQEKLSARELEILELLAIGKQNAEIAAALFISPATVKKHVEHIYTKLQVKSRVELVNWYNT